MPPSRPVSPSAAVVRPSASDGCTRATSGNIVAKALRNSPGERYSTVGAFADDLHRYLTHQPVQARADTWAYRTAKFLQRYRAPAAIGAIVALALLAAVGITWRQTVAARAQRDEALFQSHRAEAISDFQTAIISQIGVTRRSLSELLDQTVALLDRQPPADPRLHAALLLQLADRYGELERRHKQRDLLAEAEQVARSSSDLELQATLSCALANYHVEQRQIDSAIARLAAADGQLGAVRRPSADTRVICLRPAAEVAQAQERSDTAVALLQAAAAVLDSVGAGGTLRYY